MKKVLAGIPLFLLGVMFMNAQEIQVDKETIDYGTIAKESNGVRVFEITNIGEKPLIITNVLTSCGCTTPTVPKDPILPGKSAKLEVKYDTKRIGSFNKSVTIISNALEKARYVVNIKGTVK